MSEQSLSNRQRQIVQLLIAGNSLKKNNQIFIH